MILIKIDQDEYACDPRKEFDHADKIRHNRRQKTMKTRKQAANDSSIPLKLINGVCNTLNCDDKDELESTLKDIMNYGAGSGFHGFIYYRETHAFTTKYRKEIAETLHNLASEIGVSDIECIKGFNCLNDIKNDPGIDRCIAVALYAGTFRKDDLDLMDLIYNALSWFALEEVARAMVDE